MNHNDHMNLLRGGILGKKGVWADLGSGGGAFTFALAELLGPGGVIYSVDKDGGALNRQARTMASRYPTIEAHYLTADFTQPLTLPSLDGIIMANSLHFLKRKAGFVRQLRSYLKPNGRLLLVEYNTDRGNRWVPYPLSYQSWQQVAEQAGFRHTELLTTTPSRFLGSFYSAVSW